MTAHHQRGRTLVASNPVAGVRTSIATLGLSHRPVCLHTSLRSFGHLEGDADALIDAFLDEGCTLMVPTFSGDRFLVEPPGHLRRPRNGWDGSVRSEEPATAPTFDPATNEVSSTMGTVPAAVLRRPERIRGRHPLWSLTAIGPAAEALIADQGPADATAPFRTLGELGGAVVLAGVGLERCSLLHYAEALAGRSLFYRWALDEHGEVVEWQVGGCSEGFPRLWPALQALATRVVVHSSDWIVLPAAEAAQAAARAIQAEPQITHCRRSLCNRCEDAVAGGPLDPVS